MHLSKACKNTDLAPYVEDRLDALKTNRGHVPAAHHPSCHESANFEKYVKDKVDQNAATWDYLVSVGASLRKCETEALEVHPCTPDELPRIIRKKTWSEAHIEQNFPNVDVVRWVWIASGETLVLPGIPEHFQASEAGIEVATRNGYQPL